MMSRLLSGVMLASLKTGMLLRAGDHRLVDVLAGRRRCRAGRTCPGQGAAGAGEVVAHGAVDAEQLAALGGVALWPGRRASSSGMAGPGAERGDVGGERGDLLVVELDVASCAAPATPGSAIGIRPVPTWKSTAAAPTPTRRRGRRLACPRRSRPWQVAQLARNSCLPCLDVWSARLGRGVGGLGGERRRTPPPVTSRPEQEQDGDRGRVPAAGGQCVHSAFLSSCCGRWSGPDACWSAH